MKKVLEHQGLGLRYTGVIKKIQVSYYPNETNVVGTQMNFLDEMV